jgi:hypothetical protein
MLQTTLEICLKKDEYTSKIYGGVLARDELYENFTYPKCFVINTKPRSHVGEHWLALYYDDNGMATFFDSYGHHPAYYRLQSYIERTSIGYDYNKRMIQGLSSHCGYYSLLFLLFKSRKIDGQFFSYFSNDFHHNDIKVDRLIKQFL